MRLTCPNCSARYEVDDSLVPPEGRDVQCSNCMTTWFQPGSRAHTEDVAPVAQPEVPDVSVEADESTDTALEPAAPGPTRRELDPALRDILREEREREERLRRDPEAVEEQAEMPLDDPEPAPPVHEPADDVLEESEEENLAALRAATQFADELAAAPAGRRPGRELLPDIEEINSTLRSTTDRDAQDAASSDIDTMDTRPRRRRGFRLGFFLILVLALLGVGLYAFDAEIAEAVPQTAPYLESYVAQVDQLRLQLDDLVSGLASQLSDETGADTN